MIDRQYGHVVIECDSCDEVFDSGTDDFAKAWNAAKREGWTSRKIANEWLLWRHKNDRQTHTHPAQAHQRMEDAAEYGLCRARV